MIKIAICDDEKEILDKLRRIVEDYFSGNYEIAVKVSAFSSAKKLISVAEKNGGFDIYLLDVIMPEINGINLGIKLRQNGDDGIIIYLTSSTEYAVASYGTGAYFYLLKPINTNKLKNILSNAVENIEKRKKQGIAVKNSDGTVFLPFDSIMYAELRNRSVNYVLSDGSRVQSRSLRIPFRKACSELLKDNRFVLCGASFCINLSFVKSLEKNFAVFKNGSRISLPVKAIAKMNTQWLDFWLEEST